MTNPQPGDEVLYHHYRVLDPSEWRGPYLLHPDNRESMGWVPATVVAIAPDDGTLRLDIGRDTIREEKSFGHGTSPGEWLFYEEAAMLLTAGGDAQ